MSYFYGNRDHGDDDEPYLPIPNFNRSSDHKEFNKRILLTAIASLSLVLIVVFALHLYARFVLKRQARRRAAIHQLTLTVAQAHTLSTESNNLGLSPTLISTLPTFLFKQKQPQNQHSSSHVVECAVCLSVFEDEEIVKLLPNCNHTFHVGCIDTWLASNSTCPVCRTKVEVEQQQQQRIEPQPREGPTGLGLYGAPSAPPPTEGTSDGGESPKNNSRLSSFRRILSREKSFRRIQPSSCDHDINHDLERQ